MIVMAGDALTMREPAEPAQGQLLYWPLGAAIALLPVQIEVAADLRLAPSDFLLALTVLLGLGVWRGVRSAWSPWHIAFFGLFFVYVFVKSFRVGTFTQFDLVNKLGGIVVLYSFYICLTSLSDSWDNLRWFLKVFVLSVTVQNTLVSGAFLWCRYTGDTDPVLMTLLSDGVDRLAGMLVDANAYGGLLAVAFAIVLLADDDEQPLFSRGVRIACLLSLAVGLLLTSSRSTWIGVGCLSLIAGLRSPRLLLVIAAMTIVGLAMVATTIGNDQFDQFVDVSSRQNTIDERVEINHNAWQMFLAYPIFGGGIGRFYEHYDIIVHNSAMWFLAEFGILGFCIFLGFMSWFLWKGFVGYRLAEPAQKPIIAGLVAAHLAMLGLALGIEATYQRYWWFALGLLAAGYSLAERDAAAGSADPASATEESEART